jgi:hypothetical protein
LRSCACGAEIERVVTVAVTAKLLRSLLAVVGVVMVVVVVVVVVVAATAVCAAVETSLLRLDRATGSAPVCLPTRLEMQGELSASTRRKS